MISFCADPIAPSLIIFLFYRNMRQRCLRLGGPVRPEQVRVPAVPRRGLPPGVRQRRHHLRQRV